MEEVSRSLRRLTNYAAGLQDLMAELQRAVPESSQGSDRSGAVQAFLGRDGLPQAFRVHPDWRDKIGASSFSAAVTQACEAATRERGLAWLRALEKSGWQQRADRLKADPAAAEAAHHGTVPPAFRRPGASRPRSPDELAEQAIRLARDVSSRAAATPRPSPRGTGANRSRTVTLTLSPSGHVSCHADASWAAEQSAGQLTDALTMALATARQNLAASTSADTPADGADDLLERQERLLAQVFAAFDGAPRLGGN